MCFQILIIKKVFVCLGSGGREYVCVHTQISHYRQNKLPAGMVSCVCVSVCVCVCVSVCLCACVLVRACVCVWTLAGSTMKLFDWNRRL